MKPRPRRRSRAGFTRLAILLAVLGATTGLVAQAPPALPPGTRPDERPPSTPKNPFADATTAELGSVRLDPVDRAVLVTGWVNQVEGAIELLACGPGGKTHESIFVLDVNPLHLQTGLLLLGLKPGRPLPGLGAGPPEGPELDLWVEWKEGDSMRRERAERFVHNVETRATLPETTWIFTGSLIEDGQFKAQVEESLIATYWDPWAIINLPLPCGSNDEILVVNTNSVPPLHAPVTFRIKARSS